MPPPSPLDPLGRAYLAALQARSEAGANYTRDKAEAMRAEARCRESADAMKRASTDFARIRRDLRRALEVERPDGVPYRIDHYEIRLAADPLGLHLTDTRFRDGGPP